MLQNIPEQADIFCTVHTISHNKHFVDFCDVISINNSIITLEYFSQTVLLLLFLVIAGHAFTQIRLQIVSFSLREFLRRCAWQLRWPIGKSVRLIWSCRLWYDFKSSQTNDFKIGIHSFPAWRSASKGHCEEQAGKFRCCAVGKGT